jgi:uncharacterized protein YuzE
MEIRYNAKSDLVYIRLDDRKQDVVNRRLTEDIVLDIGADNRIIGIEILDASKHLNLAELLPVKYQVSPSSLFIESLYPLAPARSAESSGRSAWRL